MYIGPWQEYRLAKIQDNAIQRIRQEWEDNIRAQIPDGDDTRIRELMQPLMAKLPALLMAKTPSESADAAASAPRPRRAKRPPGTAQSSLSTRPSTAVSTASSTRSRGDRAESRKSRLGQSNQETHDDTSESVVSEPRRAMSRQATTKKGKKKSGPATALEEVERRRKMFAKWKSQQDQSSSEGPQVLPQAVDASTRLPPIHPSTPSRLATLDPQQPAPEEDPTRLPPIYHNLEPSSAEPEASSPSDEPNLEDSLDEDEVNQLLNWTDNLLSPNALEASLVGLEEDLDDVG